MPADALLTYAWVRSTYTAVRSLSRLGLRVTVADTGRLGMSQCSRLARYAGRYASPLTEPQAFIRDVSALLERSGARFLLPGHDETEVLARYRESLPRGVILPVAPVEKIALANDKARMIARAGDWGVPVPAVIPWEGLPDLARQLQGNARPLVVKLRRGNSAKGVFYPHSNEEAVQLCADLIARYRLPPARYPVVQERVTGEGWGVSCLYWEGRHLASFTHRRLREKTVTGGTSTLRESRRNPLLEEMARTLLDKLEWHGLAMVEFKFDPASGEGWFIEINPRLWGSIHLAVASGIDFPAWLYLAATQGPQVVRAQARPQQEGIVARWYLGDCIAAVGALRRGETAVALKMLLPGGADTYDDWFWDDPCAFLGEAVYYLRGFLQSRSLNPEAEGMLG